MKNEIFGEKAKYKQFSMESEIFSEIGGKSETGGNASLIFPLVTGLG